MPEEFDVVIVGARCAGSPLATLLAQRGLRVCVLDRAEFPSDTPSTHAFQAEGIGVLDRLGVLDDLLATGAPPLVRASFAIEDAEARCRLPVRSTDRIAALCVRRPALDSVLVDHARRSGADIRTSTAVAGLLWEGGRVVGVSAAHDGSTVELRAPLVVGADGRASTVGRLVGARKYHVTPSERLFYWTYYEGTAAEEEATIHLYRRGDDGLLAGPADGGAYMVAIAVSADRRGEFRPDPEAGFDQVVARFPRITAVLDGAQRVDRLHAMLKWDGYLRESAGPGWALVGDAGHFKDPTPGQGISDAFRQIEVLGQAIVGGLGAGDLDERLAAWWRWRDEDALEKYWFAYDLGRAGPVTPVVGEMLKRVLVQPRARDAFLDIFSHRVRPSKVLTPGRLMAAALRLSTRPDPGRRAVWREVRTIIGDDRRRQKLAKRPRFEAVVEPGSTGADPDELVGLAD